MADLTLVPYMDILRLILCLYAATLVLHSADGKNNGKYRIGKDLEGSRNVLYNATMFLE
jgi:uncharacterized membrane protein AbrB (regulator of aidB expression)